MKSITALILTLSIIIPSKAFSQVIENGLYYIYSAVNGHYTIDNNGSIIQNGNNIHLWIANKTKAQQWRVENKNGGIVIRSEINNNYVIDDNSSNAYNGNNIHLWEYNGSNAQLWYPQKVTDNRFILRSAVNRNYVIDVNGSGMYDGNNIQLWEYNGTNAQVWIFLKVSDVEFNDLFIDSLFDVIGL